jgi:hypothetical protein
MFNQHRKCAFDGNGKRPFNGGQVYPGWRNRVTSLLMCSATVFLPGCVVACPEGIYYVFSAGTTLYMLLLPLLVC